MKKFSFVIFAVLLCALASCNTSKEQQIVGRWVCKLVENVDGTQITVNGTSVFDSNGTVSERSKFTAKMVQEIEGVSVLFEITGSLMTEADWTVNGDNLVLSPVAVDIDILSSKYYINDTHEYLGQLSGSDLDELVGDMKTEMLKAETEKILMLQENKFVTEIDEDGKKTTCTYNRIN